MYGTNDDGEEGAPKFRSVESCTKGTANSSVGLFGKPACTGIDYIENYHTSADDTVENLPPVSLEATDQRPVEESENFRVAIDDALSESHYTRVGQCSSSNEDSQHRSHIVLVAGAQASGSAVQTLSIRDSPKICIRSARKLPTIVIRDKDGTIQFAGIAAELEPTKDTTTTTVTSKGNIPSVWRTKTASEDASDQSRRSESQIQPQKDHGVSTPPELNQPSTHIPKRNLNPKKSRMGQSFPRFIINDSRQLKGQKQDNIILGPPKIRQDDKAHTKAGSGTPKHDSKHAGALLAGINEAIPASRLSSGSTRPLTVQATDSTSITRRKLTTVRAPFIPSPQLGPSTRNDAPNGHAAADLRSDLPQCRPTSQPTKLGTPEPPKKATSAVSKYYSRTSSEACNSKDIRPESMKLRSVSNLGAWSSMLLGNPARVSLRSQQDQSEASMSRSKLRGIFTPTSGHARKAYDHSSSPLRSVRPSSLHNPSSTSTEIIVEKENELRRRLQQLNLSDSTSRFQKKPESEESIHSYKTLRDLNEGEDWASKYDVDIYPHESASRVPTPSLISEPEETKLAKHYTNSRVMD